MINQKTYSELNDSFGAIKDLQTVQEIRGVNQIRTDCQRKELEKLIAAAKQALVELKQ